MVTSIISKTCPKCGILKPLGEFHKNKKLKHGVSCYCKVCAAAYRFTHHVLNREKDNARNASYNAANPEKKKAYEAVMYAAYPNRNKERSAAYRIKNPEKARLATRAWYAANKEKAKVSGDAWAKANNEAKRIYSQNRHARKRKAGGKLSKGLSAKLFKLQKGMCPCCARPLGNDYDLDHIHPILGGGSNTDFNIQLLRGECNGNKFTKDPIDFMQSRGFLL